MLHIEYEGETLDLDLDEVTVNQATTIYKQLGLTLMTLDSGIREGNPDALRAIWWLVKVQAGDKRANLSTGDFKIIRFANAIQEANERERAELEAEEEAAPKK